MLPAYAGMIHVDCLETYLAVGAPRVCGDDPLPAQLQSLVNAVLPAYAGMIRNEAMARTGMNCAPRVCGDDPARRHSARGRPECSPRMRG